MYKNNIKQYKMHVQNTIIFLKIELVYCILYFEYLIYRI